ncbi:glycosyltransferase family 2 protein [Pseudoalteromonas sp. C2R02]|uniref:glycosyltransferase n=1 Tax=Pseudoalteromonas sp. C2R02 TaxID=2841565 RepID=UPI001C095334|nr:glycosyltransferase [Pseudoalteromonas sp. C2R02]MBU2972670.1 glycosyltransferase family 2 protein [Pseudoalteromonas sp. C2R02]
MAMIFKHLMLIMILLALAVSLPWTYFDSTSDKFIFIIGFVAIWRYGWAIQHFVRALIYLKIKFKRLRQQEQNSGDEYIPIHVFLLITSFRIETETSITVYRSIIKEAINNGVDTTIIASLVETSDERLVKQIFYSFSPPKHIRLKLVLLDGTGKRDGLAAGFRAISNSQLHLEDTVVAVVDGDSILTKGSIEKCFKFFKLNPKLGALTTNEKCILQDNHKVTEIYRRWYNLRFSQRHEFMSSIALSNKVLTLTGRMSMFRGDIIGDSTFVERVEFDFVDHWRLGRFRFLTGDDKSSWFHVLKDGWQMLYVPDVEVLTIESPPSENFLKGATMLMSRWFGNMLRTNSRAREIPRKTTGNYVWWVLYDQLISIWTSLFGLVLAIMGAIYFDKSIFLAFIFWILLTRYLLTYLLSTLQGNFSFSWPFLVYFNQIYGSMIKAYSLHHLYKQGWTRQKTTLKGSKSKIENTIKTTGSNLSLVSSVCVFLTTVAFIVGIFNLHDINAFILYLKMRFI